MSTQYSIAKGMFLPIFKFSHLLKHRKESRSKRSVDSDNAMALIKVKRRRTYLPDEDDVIVKRLKDVNMTVEGETLEKSDQTDSAIQH